MCVYLRVCVYITSMTTHPTHTKPPQNKTLPLLGPLRADVYTAPALLMSLLCVVAALCLLFVFEEKPIHAPTPIFPPAANTAPPQTAPNPSLPPTRSDVNLARGLVERQQQGNGDVEAGGVEGERSGVAVATIDGAPVSHWWPGRQVRWGVGCVWKEGGRGGIGSRVCLYAIDI